jgi:hypothetical protein
LFRFGLFVKGIEKKSGLKIILGHILIRTIDEFRGMEPEEAAGYDSGRY